MTLPVADAVLKATGLRVTFGGVHAVSDIDLEVRAGQIVGLIGPNGAGKTTTIDALTGFVSHGGVITLDGVDISGWPPHRRAAAGLGRTWQSLELFDDLSVGENCRIAAEPSTARKLLSDAVHLGGAPRDPAVATALGQLDLDEVSERLPGELSLGRRKLAAVARALAGAPKVLLLDEPAAGLDSDESVELGSHLRDVVGRDGVSILLIDHDMALVMGVCDHVYVLDFGVVVASGPPSSIRNDRRVIEAYLGSTVLLDGDSVAPIGEADPGGSGP